LDTRAAVIDRDTALAEFKKTFRELAPYKHRYEVFKDSVTMAACSLHNSIWKEPTREEEYLRLIGNPGDSDGVLRHNQCAQTHGIYPQSARSVMFRADYWAVWHPTRSERPTFWWLSTRPFRDPR
jgi:hypothetical protein